MSSGAICVNTLKKDWTATTTFAHVLSVVRCLLIIPFPESSLNDEAGRLFMDSYVEYARRAKLMAGVHGKSKPFSSDEEENDLEEKNSTLVEAKTSSGVENSGDSDVFDGKLVSGSSTSLRSSSSSMPSVPVRSGSKGSLRSNPDKLNRSGSLNSTSSDRSSLKMRTEKINKKKSLKRL
jgi:ubiquitin-conjugating enzyme E2 S